MADLKTSVEALLRPTEVCKMCLEIKLHRDGQKRARLLAVVGNQRSDEHCVFLLDRKGLNISNIQSVLPVFADFRISVVQANKSMEGISAEDLKKIKSDLLLKIRAEDTELVVETLSLEDLQNLIIELKKLTAAAQQENYHKGGLSHQWIQYYAAEASGGHVVHPSASPDVLRPSGPQSISDLSVDAISLPQDFRAGVDNPFMSFARNERDLSFNPETIRGIKEAWIAKQLKIRESEFTDHKQLSFFVGTWNVNGKPVQEDLSPWLTCDTEPDLYVVGFQELDLSAEAYMFYDPSKEDSWTKKIEEGLGTKREKYAKIASKQLIGMLIMVWIKKELISAVRDLALDSKGCGIMGMMGNKGGVAVRIRLFDTYVCFVNSHLAADSKEVDRRNQDYFEISRRISFPVYPSAANSTLSQIQALSSSVDSKDTSSSTAAVEVDVSAKVLDATSETESASSGLKASTDPVPAALEQTSESSETATDTVGTSSSTTSATVTSSVASILSASITGTPLTTLPAPNAPSSGPVPQGAVSVVGISPSGNVVLSPNPALQNNITPSQYVGIWDNDIVIWLGDLNYRIPLPEGEVKAMLKKGDIQKIIAYDQLSIERRAKRAFGEFEEGKITFQPTYKYDPGTNDFDTSEKKRTPSWCDRILWRKGDAVNLTFYRSTAELLTSDHKPVSALFDAKIKILLREKQADVYQQIVRELDKFENECMPDAVLSRNHLSFGSISYLASKTESIILENTGQVIAQYRFVPKLQDKNFCKPWLWVSPPIGMLLPGEKTKVNFTVLVDNMSAPSLNTGEDKIEDILILHLENGKDYFISIQGEYIPTCFGTSLERLTKLTGPIRSTSIQVKSEGSLSVPKEIWRIVDFLFKNGGDVESLFLTTGEPHLLQAIRDALDDGSEFGDLREQGVHAMAETLIRFLDALPEPVIPSAFFQKALDASETYSAAKQVVAQLPSVHYNVFLYLTSFLREYFSTFRDGRNNEDKIVLIFASVMLRPPRPAVDKAKDAYTQKRTKFISYFVSEANEI